MEQDEVTAFVKSWKDGNRLAQQTTISCYEVAKLLSLKQGTMEWDAAVQGAAQYRINNLAY